MRSAASSRATRSVRSTTTCARSRTALRTREEIDWKRNNPETKARASDMTRQLHDAIEKLEDELDRRPRSRATRPPIAEADARRSRPARPGSPPSAADRAAAPPPRSRRRCSSTDRAVGRARGAPACGTLPAWPRRSCTSPDDRLSPAELSAACLDGDLVELGEAYIPADAVETRGLRAGSLRERARRRARRDAPDAPRGSMARCPSRPPGTPCSAQSRATAASRASARRLRLPRRRRRSGRPACGSAACWSPRRPRTLVDLSARCRRRSTDAVRRRG